jgi:hypothetical protein
VLNVQASTGQPMIMTDFPVGAFLLRGSGALAVGTWLASATALTAAALTVASIEPVLEPDPLLPPLEHALRSIAAATTPTSNAFLVFLIAKHSFVILLRIL